MCRKGVGEYWPFQGAVLKRGAGMCLSMEGGCSVRVSLRDGCSSVKSIFVRWSTREGETDDARGRCERSGSRHKQQLEELFLVTGGRQA